MSPALLPVAGLAIVFFSLVGLEEWLGIAVLSEPVSRATPITALLLIAFFLMGSLALAAWCVYVRAYTMGGVAQEAGLAAEEVKKLR